jgi:hypothetical protein
MIPAKRMATGSKAWRNWEAIRDALDVGSSST